MAKSMLQKFEKCWDDMYGVMAIVIVLDPRHKIIYTITHQLILIEFILIVLTYIQYKEKEFVRIEFG